MLKVDDFRLINYSRAFWEKIHTDANNIYCGIYTKSTSTLLIVIKYSFSILENISYQVHDGEDKFIIIIIIIITIIIRHDVIIWQGVLVEMRSIGLSAVSAYSQMPSPSHHHIVITISVYCHDHDGPHDQTF